MKKDINLRQKTAFSSPKVPKNEFFRVFFAVFLSIFLCFSLVLGIGIVDNCNKLAQNNPFLNGIFYDSDNYILCMRYLNLKMKIPLSFKGVINDLISFLNPLFISISALFTKIKDIISNL